ncbi:hypothetical protein L6452_36047 [Arctium lappa]|uniref:Uncharacterized protein n=1 Tax=Arctium lappa TaxID=4217 RepID=A0ACB8Y8M1_ARCLA|nr:hypothetical protein L6452_36047 [Arctium lappa]
MMDVELEQVPSLAKKALSPLNEVTSSLSFSLLSTPSITQWVCLISLGTKLRRMIYFLLRISFMGSG